jgi:diguanylate cyclase (GGDEF)-like protein/PAS domain S-box-containing protein
MSQSTPILESQSEQGLAEYSASEPIPNVPPIGAGQAEPQFDGLLEAAPDAMVILDGEGRMVFVNAQTEQMFAYPREELLGQPVEMLMAAPLRDVHSALLAEYSSVSDARPMSSSVALCGQRRDGSDFPMDVRFGQMTTSDGTFVMGILHDITELKQHEESLEEQGRKMLEANARLEELVTQDSLTELKNHRAFRQQLEEEFRRAARYRTPLSVLMLDLDYFKSYNDTFGHAAGDEVLRAVARLLQGIARATDFVARYGGEEFVILLPFTDRAGAAILADRFRRAIEEARWEERAVTVSVGAATFDAASGGALEAHEHVDADALLVAADRALYHSKRAGRNRITHDADLSGKLSAESKLSPDGTLAPEKKPAPRITHRQATSRHSMSNPLAYGWAWLSRAIREENIFLFLLGVRWISLLPPLLAFWLHPTPNAVAVFIFIIALLSTIILSVFQAQFNRLVLQKPTFLLLDMALSTTFIAFTGGMDSPYDRYARLPLLAAAFFFQIRGGLVAAAAFVPLYIAALLIAHQWSGALVDIEYVVTQIFLSFLLALIFGYPSVLLQRLRAATSQLHHAQQEAARAETLAAMGKMAANVSHEIRNPLSTIGGFARSMLRRPDDVERVRKNTQIIADEVLRLEELLTDMLDMARAPALKLHPENLHEILDKAWLLSGGALGEKPLVTVRKNYEANLPLVEADASTLLRAFLNVTRNAVQMMPEGGVVTITTSRSSDEEVRVVIADTGPGIAAETLPTIFTPFVTHRPNGTGLGLSATQRIVQEHGGRIEARSEPGKGAQFIFHFPTRPPSGGEAS